MERLVGLSIHSVERDMYLSAFTIHNNRPKRKSFTIGELENSGLRRTQLETIIRWCRLARAYIVLKEGSGGLSSLLKEVFQTDTARFEEFGAEFDLQS